MLTQLTIEEATAAGHRGMAHAEDGAGIGFAEQDDRFIANFARFAESPFSSEEVVARARHYGLAPRDERAWGAAFQRAARAGAIKRSTETYRRTKGRGTIALKWERA